MDFAETEEQSMIREMVRDFAEEVLAPTCLDRDRNQKPPLDEWKAFCEYGLQGITIPEEFGGNPIDDISEAIIVEELARSRPLILSHVLCTRWTLFNDYCPTW